MVMFMSPYKCIYKLVTNIQLKMMEDNESQSKIRLIQKHIRGKVCRMSVRKMIKRAHTRKYVIEEFINSQENYIRDLGFIVSDFKMKLKTNQIISQESMMTLFSNVDEIRKLHQDFFIILYNHCENYHPNRIIFADILKNILFFRIYIEYLNNFPNAYNHVTFLQNQNKKFAQFLKYIEKTPKYKLLRIEDYLVKPVQRLPKYVLLMKQIKKNTDHDHPDYANISKALQKFQEVNKNNNAKLMDLRQNYKLAEMQRTLVLPEGTIGPGVSFVMEETVQILTADGKAINGTLYLLNTSAIVTRKVRGKERLQEIVPIKHGTGIIYNQDQSYYRYSLTIQSIDGQCCIFLCQSEDQVEKLGSQLKKQIERAELSNYSKIELMFKHNSTTESFLKMMNLLQLMPDVNVLGTSQRNDKLLKYTIYIVQIKVKSIRQKIFLRFSQVLEIEQLFKTEFPEIHIKQGMVGSGWLRNHSQKTIEERKMNIQRFLKEILSKPEVIEKGQKILLKLGLPVDFYQLPKKFKNTEDLLRKSGLSQKSIKNTCRSQMRKNPIRISIFDDSSSEDEEITNKSIKNSLTIQDLLKANQINLGHYTRYTEELVGCQKVNIKLNVLIPCVEDEKGYRRLSLNITSDLRIQCLLPIIAKKIGLKYFKDFRLFIEKQFSHRVLDDDQLATKVLNEMQVGQKEMKLKKLIYIDNQTEQKQLKCDGVRLGIVASQIVHEIKKGKYKLSYDKYLKFAVLTGITMNTTNPKPIQQVAKVTKLMVLPKYTSLIQSQMEWISDYEKMYNIIKNKLQLVMNQNRISITSNFQLMDYNQISTSIKNLAFLAIIRELSGQQLFGSVSYAVQVSEQVQDYINDNVDEIDQQQAQTHNCWLAIKCDFVYLVSISLKKQILVIEYENITKIEPFSNSLLLHINNQLIPLVKLKTVYSYYIRQLLVYYKNYNIIFNKMISGNCSVEDMIELTHDQEQLYEKQYIS